MGAFDRVGGARPVKELRDAAGGARLVAIVADAASDEVIRNLIADQAMTGAQVARGGIDDAIALMRDLRTGRSICSSTCRARRCRCPISRGSPTSAIHR